MIKYGVFEPLLIDFNRHYEPINRLTRYAYQYDPKIFEKNESWKNYFEEIKNISLNVGLDELEASFQALDKAKFIEHINYEETLKYDYKINEHIKYDSLNDILSHENIKRIKEDPEGLYLDYGKRIDELEKQVQGKNSEIEKLKNDRLGDFLNEILKRQESLLIIDTAKLKYKIKNLKELQNEFSEVLNNALSVKHSVTVFTLVKYGISYTEYSEYKKHQKSSQ